MLLTLEVVSQRKFKCVVEVEAGVVSGLNSFLGWPFFENYRLADSLWCLAENILLEFPYDSDA